MSSQEDYNEKQPLILSQPLVSVNRDDDFETPLRPSTWSGSERPMTSIERLTSSLSSLGDPLAKAGSMGTFFSICKIIVGVGSFVMPYQTGLLGIGGALMAITVLSALCFYCNALMIGIKQEFTPLQALTMPEFARSAIPVGKRGCKWNKVLGSLCEIGCVGVSIGGCAVYLNFTGGLLSSIHCEIPAYLYVLATSAVVWLFVLLQAVLLVWRSWDPLLFVARASSLGVVAALVGKFNSNFCFFFNRIM